MNKSKKTHVDLGNDKIVKIFLNYAIPSILAMLAESTAGLVDSIFIGRYVGAEGLSAITLIMPILMLLAGIGTMVGIGGTTLAGIHKGKKELEKSNNYFNVTIVLLSIAAVTGTVLLIGLSGKLSSLLGAKGKVAEFMIDYTKTISLFFLPFLLTFAFTFFLKLDGKPVEVVVIILSGTMINILLDYLFVGVLGWSMKGAALATGVSQLIPWVLMLYMIKYKSSWKFSLPIFRRKEIWAMLFNGSSELLSMAAASIAGFIYNVIIIKKIGIQGVAAYSVALQITTISTAVFYGFAEAIQSAVSFNIGAQKLHRVKKLRNMSIYANLASGFILCLVSLIFGEGMASIFIKEQGTINMAANILYFYSFAFILSGVNITLATYYTAVNSPVLSGMLALSRSLIALIIGLIILPLIFGDQGIWMAVIFAEVATIIVGIVCMRRYPFGSLKENEKKEIA
ncbi:MATE family efflux transporter [Oceanirhabdus seepicola]|uniref:Polysaccharide biosynthesis C-terminal domain-containing protein n=1 Tax=Oceanirhabdus seepicola TaxID=2828781 RepID=A0A9J6NYT5_9CLOT|nr:MATE family efflux transporter [Oceanirhabdus seepicola]MCM1989435.1 polysaccharide biosynthesis C-terminal domain-containing protein [Oceanirhabdus seepicola]